MEFKTNRIFKMWAYTISHKMLFLRSEMQYPDLSYSQIYDDPNCTIDIEFIGVKDIKIETQLDGVVLKVVETKARNGLGKLKKYQIISGTNKFYVVAEKCIIGKSTWLNKYKINDYSLSYDEILYEN